MEGYLGGRTPKFLKAITKQRIMIGFFIACFVVAILLVLDYGFGIPIYRKKKSNFTERTAEGLQYNWNTNKLVKGHRAKAIQIMMKNYNLSTSLVDADFSNFSDFTLVKFIEDSDEPDESRRAKVLLMLQPEYRKYQTIIMKATKSRILPAESREVIHKMLTTAGIIMPPLETITDTQLIIGWQTTKSPIV
jgi:hypothetical protein